MAKDLEQPTPSADGELFQRALEGVTPIPPTNRVAPTPPRRKPLRQTPPAVPTITDTLSDHNVDEVAATSFLRNGLSQMTLRKLRRGQWPIQDSIDLHGSTSEEARRLLVAFLHHAQHNGQRCVCVIHGKGWRTESGIGVLKVRVRHWLTQYPQVLAFCEAPANAGGAGAVWVLLKSNV